VKSNAIVVGRVQEKAQFEPFEQVNNRIREIAWLSARAIDEFDRQGWNNAIRLVRSINKLAVEGVEHAALTPSLSQGARGRLVESPLPPGEGEDSDVAAGILPVVAAIEAAKDAFEMIGVDAVGATGGRPPEGACHAPLPREFAGRPRDLATEEIEFHMGEELFRSKVEELEAAS